MLFVKDVLKGLTRYRVIEKLGAGGMGEVYKADDLQLLRTVAIKVLSKTERESPGAGIRFLREARAASQINHPNIVTIHEVGEMDENAFIVMEYIEGRSLRHSILTRSLKPEAVLDIARQICDALAEAHSRGVIHRDVKPENILVTERGLVKVLDFGLAKAFGAFNSALRGPTMIDSLTESGTVMGTLSYMSPEQLRGHQLDERTDIFSFGIVLYEVITGRLPFLGDSPFEVAASILKDRAIEIGDLPAGFPRGIDPIVMRCLEKNCERRFPSFIDVKNALLALPEQTIEQTAGLISPTESMQDAATGVAPKQSSPPTILVLPLEAVGSGDDSSYIGVGLAHAIITDLAKIGGLSVLSKAAGAGRIDQMQTGAHNLARQLGATILLEGEVMRSGELIGIMARLTDAESGRVIWGAQYRGDVSDLFSIQDAVCESVAAALKLSISNEVRDQIARPATTNMDAFELYSKGRAFLERRDVKENIDSAIQVFEEALRLDSEFALAQAGLGEAYWRKYLATRDAVWFERAIAAGDRALVLDPYQAQVHVSLGIVYHGTGKIERAIEEFERARELQPVSDDPYRWLGRCYMQKGEMAQAISYFERAIEVRPGYWDNYNALGIGYYLFGRYRDAAEQFRRVITIQPDNYQGYDKLGSMYSALGLYEDALVMHERAIEIYPNPESYSNLGTAYFYLGRYEEATQAYRAAIELSPHDDILYRNLGDAYLRVGKAREAGEQYEQAGKLLRARLAINPDDAPSLGDLAICHAKLGSHQEAINTIERAAQLEPRNTDLMYQRAVVYALVGEARKATENLSRALAHGYSRSEAERDPDLETLRESPEYRALFYADGQ
jgi:serine/threonine protein kinase/tetratricopeptide (TPR) repeat protein